MRFPFSRFVPFAFSSLTFALAACNGGATVGSAPLGPGAPGATMSASPSATPKSGATPSPTPGASASASATPAPSATPSAGASPTAVATNASGTPLLQHVFLLILENQAEDNTFGSLMPVPYLSATVAGQGAFVPNYYGTSHNSLGNYISLFSGQSVTTLNQEDCPVYTQILASTLAAYNQISGTGCVYPATVTTLEDQLAGAKYTAKGYMEDMGNDTTREAATCGQTQPTATTGVYASPDLTQTAQAGNALQPTDQYAMRHNPWPYFMSVISSGACAAQVRPLNDSTLAADLKSVATTANFTWITPNLCNDGHDVPCSAAGDAGNTTSTYDNENAFLQKWIPLIVRSPAFLQDGLLIVTFDESSPAKNAQVGTDTTTDSSSCCQESIEVDPNTSKPGSPPGDNYADGSGGGRTGTVILSPFIAPGTVTSASYNHYNTLRSIEDEFGLAHLGFAAYPQTGTFGSDIFGAAPTRHTIAL